MPVYDWRKTVKSALKAGALAAAGVIVASWTGLSALLLTLVPPEWAPIGAIVLAAIFGALQNALKNWNREDS